MSQKNAYVTITTASHLAQTLAVIESLSGAGVVDFKVLVVDAFSTEKLPACIANTNIEYAGLDSLVNDPTAAKIIAKYTQDSLRWSLKSVVVKSWLLNGYDSVVYVDNDCFFFYKNNLYSFELLGESSVLLCPHWRIKDPALNADWFEVNFTDGVFNAGFVGATQQGKNAMQWWAEACAYKCEKDHKNGLHDDQKYLDLVPAIFDNVGIINHRGCNVAYWNKQENKRSQKTGLVFINDEWPLVFIHFTPELVRAIKGGNELALIDSLFLYESTILKYKNLLG